MGCTVDELIGRMSSDEFQGHAEDLIGVKFEDEEEAAVAMTPERMAELLGLA